MLSKSFLLPAIGLWLVACSLSYAQKTVVFNRLPEPRENALTLLVPRGWQLEGGAIRLTDERIAGANNMIDCKFDMAVKNDPAGTVMIRWLPEILCIDASMAWGNPEGAIFNNCLVRYKRSPERFIAEVAIPYAHPRATGIQFHKITPLPALADRYLRQTDPALAMVTRMSYQACLAEFSYSENGTHFRERMTVVIEDYGTNGGGLWKNRETMLIRAPEGQLPQYEAILNVIQNSGIWNLKWVAGEVNGQRQRAGQVLATQQELQAMDKAITEHRRNTYSEINRDMYQTLTGTEDFINPFTGERETDSSSWKDRWVDESGNVIFSDQPGYNPNTDPGLNVSGFKRSTRPNQP